VRLTKAGQMVSEPLTLTLDKRATFSLADRQAQFAAAERVKSMFERMSKMVAQINGVRDQTAALAESATAVPDVKAAAAQLDAGVAFGAAVHAALARQQQDVVVVEDFHAKPLEGESR